MTRKLGIKNVILIVWVFVISGKAQEPIQLEPIHIAPSDSSIHCSRSIFDIQSRFGEQDTVLLIHKIKGLEVTAVETKNVHELLTWFRIDAGFSRFGRYKLVICDSTLQQKATAMLDILASTPPSIDSVRIRVLGRTLVDSLLVDPARTLGADLCIFGSRLPRDATVEFSDPAVSAASQHSPVADDPSDALYFGIEIKPEAALGEGTLTLKSPYAPAAVKRIFFRAVRPPRLFSEINDLTADGKGKSLVLEGSGFVEGIQVKMQGLPAILRYRRLSSEKIEIRFSLPPLEEAARCRLIIQNPDGQADTSNTFFILPAPLAAVRAEPIDQPILFSGKPARLLITAAIDINHRLQKNKTYELVIDSKRFPVQVVTSDSTCEAEIELPISGENRFLVQHIFTLQEAGRPPQWRGVFSSRQPPRIDSISNNLILHPGDSLTMVLKGARLKDLQLGIADPEVSFQILEQRDDLLRVMAAATLQAKLGDYPLIGSVQGVTFSFDALFLSLRPWQPFNDYVVFHLSSSGDLPLETCFRGIESTHVIKPDETISLRIKPSQLNPKLGIQKLMISGVLTDSSGAIRAEALDSRRIVVTAGDEEILWRWRARERIRSGDRLEITLQNPGNQNRITEYFVVAPHWSEAFHGSTSFVLCKIPFRSDEKTQILNSIGLGVSWQPFIKKRFFEIDASFIVGNAKSEKSDYAVQVGTGLSTIFWQHLQIGVGVNFSGQSFSKGFLFIGTRFKLPVSL